MRYIAVFLILTFNQLLYSQESFQFRFLTDRIVELEIVEGKVNHALNGQALDDVTIERKKWNTDQSANSINFSLSSSTDTIYQSGVNPVNIYRKTKAVDFSPICESWEYLLYYDELGCNNSSEDHILKHHIYLEFDASITEGNEYEITIQNDFFSGNFQESKGFELSSSKSSAIHVNNVGYSSMAPWKMAYVYAWLGDGGPLPLMDYEGKTFQLIDVNSDNVVFSGELSFRKDETQIETYISNSSTYQQNFNGAIVYECDFSAYDVPGYYYLTIEGIGRSNSFAIACNAIRPAFEKVMKGVVQNRSGISLEPPISYASRPAPHNPQITPGFSNRLKYTSTTLCEVSDSDANPADKLLWETGYQGDLESWGWYQDAGDWDAYPSHFKIPSLLMFAFERFSENFADNQLLIPEMNNGIPDILDEARWLPRFYYRLKEETESKNWTTGGIPGARIFGDLWGSDLGLENFVRGSWQDNDRDWYVSGEDIYMSFLYAGMAAQFQYVLNQAGLNDPENINWLQEAENAYSWAIEDYVPGESCQGEELDWAVNYAAAALFRLTNVSSYEAEFITSWNSMFKDEGIQGEQAYGAYIYAFYTGMKDPVTDSDVKSRIESTGDYNTFEIGPDRSCRWGGNPFFPMLSGHGTTPLVVEGIMARELIKNSDPQKAMQYAEIIYSTVDYTLGTNPLGITWITGMNETSPTGLLDLDSWARGQGEDKDGIVPYGPWRDDVFSSPTPFNNRWPNQWAYPDINLWPGHEKWYSQRYTALGPEYTIHQTNAIAAFVYGALSGEYDCPQIVDIKNVELENESEIKIYPNPTTSSFRIVGAFNRYDVSVINSIGQIEMYLPDTGNNYDIDLEGLGSGVYFIRIEAKNGTIFLEHLIKM